MDNKAPFVSVIIPTYNRSETILRTLKALDKQTYPAGRYEVIVVADGCTDSTLESLKYYSPRFALRVLEQPHSGGAVARNHGASQAQGPLLVFLDDDIEAFPDFIKAHVDAHQGKSRQVVIGYLPPILETQTGFFKVALRNWWETMFDTMRQPGHRFRYRDVLSGNISLDAKLFEQVGRFNPSFRCHEDYELGVRLLRAGATICFSPDAGGYHHEYTNFQRALSRKCEEGKADVSLARLYPSLLPVLPLAFFERPFSKLARLLRWLIFAFPLGGKALALLFRYALGPVEGLRARKIWTHLVDLQLDYWYWQGVKKELSSRQTILHFCQHHNTPCEANEAMFELDLRKGLAWAERQLDQMRPPSVRLCYGRHLVGCITSEPGVELLHGGHLRPRLALEFAWPFLGALAAEGIFENTFPPNS